jgi:Do/DeqQ family serine protease
MQVGKFFHSKIIFGIALITLVLGFVLGILFVSCSTRLSTSDVAYAQDKGISSDDIAALEKLQYSFRVVAKSALPVVVEIDVVDIVEQAVPSSPFDFFFNPFEQREGDDSDSQQFRKPGLGSGVLVKRQGNKIYALTNNHVVGDAEEIKVTLYDGRSYESQLVGGDVRKDLALVVFETKEDVPVAMLGNSNDLQVGDWVLAVGNPFGFESTVTAGIVSALGRRGGPGENISDFIQTDAAISPGNSGGALVNIKGQVVGINTWIASNTGGNIGYGFAIPINNAKKAIDDFISYGKVEYAWLGVQITTPFEELAAGLGIEGKNGALVTQVFRDSPADRGGILPGDFVVALNDESIKDHLHLTNLLGDQEPGKYAEFDIVRYGEPLHLSIKLAVREDEKKIIAQNKSLWPGMSVLPLSQRIKDQLKISTKGYVIIYDVLEGTPAGIAGFRQEDVIISINDNQIRNLMDFYRTLNDKMNKELVFQLERKGEETTIGLVR